MNYSNLYVQQWVYLSNNGNNNWATFLVSDNTKQAVMAIDLDTGLFVPDNIDNNLVLNGDQVFKVISNDSGSKFTKVFQIGSNSLVAFQDNLQKNPKLITFTNNSISTSDLSINSSNSANRLIASVIYTGSKSYGVVIDKEGIANNDNTVKFNQYLITLSLSGSVLNFSGQLSISHNYIVSGTNTTLENTDDFKNRFFIRKNGNDSQIIFLSGSSNNNYIEIYNASNLAKISFISLVGNDVNSLTYSPNFDKLYIGNNKSLNNIYLSYVDLNSGKYQLTTIQQSTQSNEKKYFLVPVLESKEKEYLIKMSSDQTNPTYMIYSNNAYSDVANSIMPLKGWYTIDDLTTSIGQAYTPNGITDDVIKSHLYINYSGGNASQKYISRNLENGTVKYGLEISYSSVYDENITSSFTLMFYIQGLSKSSSYKFNWIDDSTTDSNFISKAKEISSLKNNNYPNRITAKEVIDNFIDYKILNKYGEAVIITESMISLLGADDTGNLVVTIDLSKLNLPIGTTVLKQVRTYKGFLSTNTYNATINDNSIISNFSKTIYPSKLTKEEIVNNFLSTKGLMNTISNWEIIITNIDDYDGTVTISSLYINPESQIKNSEQLSTNYFSKF